MGRAGVARRPGLGPDVLRETPSMSCGRSPRSWAQEAEAPTDASCCGRGGGGITPGAVGNAFCDELEIAVPDVAEVWERARPKLFWMMVACVLERGEPLFIEEIAARLAEVGVEAPSGGDLRVALTKAWHGLAPLKKRGDGRLGLDMRGWELGRVVRDLDLDGRSREPSPAFEKEPPFALPGPEVALAEEELEAAFAGSISYAYSKLRLVAAVLDVDGGALDLVAINERLTRLDAGSCSLPITAKAARQWRKRDLIIQHDDRRLELNCASADVAGMRDSVRRRARTVLERKHDQERWKASSALRRAEEAEQLRTDRERASGLTRALVRAVPKPSRIEALVLLALPGREIEVFFGVDVQAARERLAAFDVVAGEEIGATLAALGLEESDPERIAIDLRPPRKSVRLNKRGRTLKVTTELLIRGTTGVSKPFGAEGETRSLLARGDRPGLEKRLTRDIKALYAYYRYGVLHEYVRLRWGFLDDVVGVGWAIAGDRSLYDLKEEARERGVELEVVSGGAPGWRDPWSRARRTRIVPSGGFGDACYREDDERLIDDVDIQAARLSSEDLPSRP